MIGWMNRDLIRLILMPALVLASAAGCSSLRVTDPPRTATEQFLISQAAREAVAQISTEALRDRLVYIDTRNFMPGGSELNISEGRNQLYLLDRQFTLGALRAHFLQSGVRLTNQPGTAQVIVEVRSAGLGIDRSDYLLGVPPVLVPAGDVGVDVNSGTLVTPEIALLKNIEQEGYASIAYVAYWRETGEVLSSSGPFVGRTYRVDWWYFGVGPRTAGDIPTAVDE